MALNYRSRESCWPGWSCRCRNNKVKRCRFVEVKNGFPCRTLLLFSGQVLPAVCFRKQDCGCIFGHFGAMLLVARTSRFCLVIFSANLDAMAARIWAFLIICVVLIIIVKNISALTQHGYKLRMWKCSFLNSHK